jgi:hypothetical protein
MELQLKPDIGLQADDEGSEKFIVKLQTQYLLFKSRVRLTNVRKSIGYYA